MPVRSASGDFRADRRDLAVVDRLERDSVQRGSPAHFLNIGQQECPAAVIQEPLAFVSVAQRIEDETVRLQVVRLAIVHRDEQVLRGQDARERRNEQGGEKESTEGDATTARH